MLSDGKVAESGTHEQLVDSGGTYSQLWSAQETLFSTADAEPKSEEEAVGAHGVAPNK